MLPCCTNTLFVHKLIAKRNNSDVTPSGPGTRLLNGTRINYVQDELYQRDNGLIVPVALQGDMYVLYNVHVSQPDCLRYEQ